VSCTQQSANPSPNPVRNTCVSSTQQSANPSPNTVRNTCVSSTQQGAQETSSNANRHASRLTRMSTLTLLLTVTQTLMLTLPPLDPSPSPNPNPGSNGNHPASRKERRKMGVFKDLACATIRLYLLLIALHMTRQHCFTGELE